MGRVILIAMLRDVARAVARDLGEQAKEPMAYIRTAGENSSEQGWRITNRDALVEAGFRPTNYTITSKSAVELRRDLAEFPILCFEGGDPFTCWSKCRK